jgi:flagellar protein FlgJ
VGTAVANQALVAIHPISSGPALASLRRSEDGPRVREVASRATPTAPASYRAALARAYREVTGKTPTSATLDVLSAHVAHETGRGERMFNFNFGGIKGAGPSGLTARYRTHEYLDGKKVSLVDGFRAYKNIDEGATDYLRLLEKRYGSAFRAAAEGDVDGFAAALKSKGYYTAPAAGYAAALRSLAKEEPSTTSAGSAGAAGEETMASIVDGMSSPLNALPTVALARVIDDATAMAARLAAPIDEVTAPSWTQTTQQTQRDDFSALAAASHVRSHK